MVNALRVPRRDGKPWIAEHFIEEYRNAWRLTNELTEVPQQKQIEAPKPVVQRVQSLEEMQRWIEIWVKGSNIAIQEAGGRRK